MKIEQNLYFPTPIWCTTVAAHEALDADLLEWVRDLRARQPGGAQRSNLGGWQSSADLHESARFEALRQILDALGKSVARDYGFDDGAVPVVQNAWANVNGPGCGNAPHVHPGAALSGVYYVQIPDRAGDLEFLDPRGAALTAGMLYPQRQPNALTRNRVAIRAQAGLIVLFPGWLQHYVAPNQSSGERIGFSFNLTFERRG